MTLSFSQFALMLMMCFIFASHTVVAVGGVLSFGFNADGRTGLGTTSGSTTTATPIDTSNLSGLTITQVAGGAGHSLLLGDNGSVFSFGGNIHGQTGLGTTSGDTTVATPIDTSNLGGLAITQVAAGGESSLLLAENGNVFSFGANDNGQTALGTSTGDTTVATPIDTSNLGGLAVTQVALGWDHGLLLAEDGSVFSFGSNDNGRTGLGTASGDTLVATPIDTSNLGGLAIEQVAASAEHSLLLAEDGSVFSFGANQFGQTGLGTTSGDTLIATPIDTSNLGGLAIEQVAAGSAHSLLLAEDGSVFSFGWNGRGQTGLGTTSGNTTVATPIDNSNLGGLEITQVDAGVQHSLLLAEDGSVYSFGHNSTGRTGLGFDTFSTTSVATAIDTTNLAGLATTQIAAGFQHNLLIAVPEPSSISLVGVALIGLLRRGRQRREES